MPILVNTDPHPILATHYISIQLFSRVLPIHARNRPASLTRYHYMQTIDWISKAIGTFQPDATDREFADPKINTSAICASPSVYTCMCRQIDH
jgi:hypothetical protein